MSTAKRNFTTKRPARGITLTMVGFHAAWFLEQQEQLAARPANATAPCGCCDEIYATAGLKSLASDEVYEQASSLCSFERDALLCPACRKAFESEYISAEDVYHVYDTGRDRND
jgi:hypothetical protein